MHPHVANGSGHCSGGLENGAALTTIQNVSFNPTVLLVRTPRRTHKNKSTLGCVDKSNARLSAEAKGKPPEVLPWGDDQQQTRTMEYCITKIIAAGLE